MSASRKPLNSVPPRLPAMFTRYEKIIGKQLYDALPSFESTELTNVMRYHLGWSDRDGNLAATTTAQGKALRPTLCVFACEAMGGDPKRALPSAAALELIHNFSLLHDDIQDQGYERRHQPTVWSIWGTSKALIAGDGMHSVGDISNFDSVSLGVNARLAIQISAVLTESYLEMIEGQCRDLVFEQTTNIKVEEYLGMIALKTGALIRSSALIGALIGRDDSRQNQAVIDFGNYIGRAFQIRDDFLGIWGDASTTGKTTSGDIEQRKKSLPIVVAFEDARGAAADELLRIYRPDNKEELSDNDIEIIRMVLDEVKAAERCQLLTEQSSENALTALNDLDFSSWAVTEAKDLVNFLSTREF